jgi:PilZ domain
LANGASAMATAFDRRRHKRFEITSPEHRLALVTDSGSKEEREPCVLLNVSYGGMRFRASRALQEGAIHRFFIEMPLPIGFAVRVKARICWVWRFASQGYDLGAEFLESSKGWLGPED